MNRKTQLKYWLSDNDATIAWQTAIVPGQVFTMYEIGPTYFILVHEWDKHVEIYIRTSNCMYPMDKILQELDKKLASATQLYNTAVDMKKSMEDKS